MKLKEILLKRLEKETIYEDGFGEKSVTEVIEQVFKEAESKQFYITDVVKSLPTKEDIKLKAKEETSFPKMCYPNDIMEISCCAKYKEGAEWMREQLLK